MKTKIVILLVISFLFAGIDAFAQTAEDYFKSGYAKADKGDYTEAIADWTKAIEINPVRKKI
jgi:tetratricopeptide (TPR) repeat protein